MRALRDHHQRTGQDPRRTALCQAKAKATSRQTPTATGATRKLHVMGVDDDDRRINSSWWVKRSGQMHGDDCEPDGGGRRPWSGADDVQHQQPDRGGHQVTANKRARLSRLGLR